MSEFTISWDPLDNGIIKDQSVKPCWKLIFGGKTAGHKSNSLDAIMARDGSDVLYARIEAIGAKGGRAFTVTFKDEYLNKYKETYLEQQIRTLTKKTKGVLDFEYVSEYSKTGRFHLHGCVLVQDIKVLASLRRKYSKFGICKVKVVDNSVGWATYCLKDRVKEKS